MPHQGSSLECTLLKIYVVRKIILDYLAHREPHFLNSRIITLAGLFSDTENYVCAHTILDVNYFLRKQYGSTKAQDIIEQNLNFLNLAPTTEIEISKALTYRWNDFEDAVVSASAETICADFIITRNKKDFKMSKIRVLTPSEFLDWLEGNNIVLDVLDLCE